MQHAVHPKRPHDTRFVLGVLAVGIVLVLAALIVVPWLQGLSAPAAPDYWPTAEWRTAPPETQGIDSDMLAGALLRWHEAGVPIHSLTIVRNGYVVADAAFYPYDGQTVHDLASVSKSIMTTLIGIAAGKGELDLDDPMVSFFPDYTIANRDARKEAVTVRHLASMSSGLRCTRDGFPNDSVRQMHASADFVQYALDLPMASQPGSTFVYCSPAIHLLSPILQQATGQPALDYARQNLFEPLGIRDVTWEQDPQGYYDGWGDIALRPLDMAKIGLLMLEGGRWEDKQVVSRDWVEAATTVQIAATNEDPYGYGWWITEDPGHVVRADGRGGQYIIALPELELLVVTTGGGFDIDAIDEDILATLVDMENPLPPNPDGEARLAAATATVAQPPLAQPVPPLPAMAATINGRPYAFEANRAQLDSLALSFDGSAEALAEIGIGGYPPVVVPVGLDGLYRVTTALPGGEMAGFRGRWLDEQTFLLEYNAFTANDQEALTFRYEDGRAAATIGATASMPAIEFTGVAE